MQKTYRIGPIRPPSEANSLLLQITEGCTWNRCKFCSLYRRKKFKAFSVESIKKDIDVMAEYAELAQNHQLKDGTWDRRAALQILEKMTSEEQECYYFIYRWLVHGGENVFLQDGNSLAVKTERILEVLRYLREKLPSIRRITTYGRAETLSKISVEQYRQLKEAGLDRIHSGFESGSDRVLELINKGVTSEQEITAGRNIKESGIELSVYFMPGVGGKEYSRENAIETARVVSAINPDYIRIRSTIIYKSADLWDDYLNGSFQMCSENDKLMEIKLLIENIKGCTTVLVSDHMNNLLQNVQGRVDLDRQKMLSMIDEYFAMPEYKQKMFQIARRSGLVTTPADLDLLSRDWVERISAAIESIKDEAVWNREMNNMMSRYT
ncbi:MAG: radical SAM protein [Eubacteriales bacterium]|nr:radical SAM protein [Eubacteriales bacterium]